MRLQGLAFRLFLVGSHRDRQLLQPVCLFTVRNGINWPDDFWGYVDLSDSRIIAEAYSGLVTVWQETFDTETLSVDLAMRLVGFVHRMAIRSNPDMCLDELLSILYTSLRLLWLIFEHRGRILVDDHARIRGYAITVFVFLEAIQLKRICTSEDQYMLAKVLGDIEFVALAGRVFLLARGEGE
ncbi:hypothetical protein FRC12_000464 [Ceratobasidium sp. 428]|nr:hypothetical protein FRC12_000464 [Ceratobasidium sp. 428]